MIPDLFGGALKPDPSVALKPYLLPPELCKQGSLHRLHYLVEIVGQRTLPAAQAKALLEDKWQQPLGRPAVFVMAAADDAWRALLTDDTSAAYDSIALAWPYLTDRGNLSKRAAEQLLAAAEHFAGQVGRRAMPLPTPDDVDSVARMLLQARDNLDVGVTLLVIPKGAAIHERDIWLGCAALGLEYVSPGVFQWLAVAAPSAASTPEASMLEVAPFEDAGWFSLGSVESGKGHDGFSIGFSVPLSPDPVRSAEGALEVASLFESRYDCVAFDDSHRPLDAKTSAELLAGVRQGRDALMSGGIRPGSREAIALFADQSS